MDILTQKDLSDKYATLIATNIALEDAKREHEKHRTYITAQNVQDIERRRDELRRLIRPTLVH